jgi:hypothetical protein
MQSASVLVSIFPDPVSHMSPAEKKKIVYLFGAGATHAELNLDPNLLEEKRLGLLIGDVSSRVIEQARRKKKYLKDVEMVSGTGGSLNIELLISLIENSKVCDWANKTSHLKKLVKIDINNILTESRTKHFYLHKALLEFHGHEKTKTKENVIGHISLNYDDVLDQAYKTMLGVKPNYCFSLENDHTTINNIPLLKLHGSFNWVKQFIRGKKRRIEIIPLGSSKSYLHAPYGFIWNRALEILIECDVLRVIGCSLNSNDIHLIDLLFKAHLERSRAFDIEIVDFDVTGEAIQKNYGFFPQIKKWSQLEGGSMADPNPHNPFKTWLKYKSIGLLGEASINETQHLKNVMR